jgi:DNA-binding NtrC family response regulator
MATISSAGSPFPSRSARPRTAYATKLAVEAIKAGAIDYLSKPFEPEELLHAVARCAERYKLIQENTRLRSQTSQTFDVSNIIGDSPRMVDLRNLIKTVALSNATVLILGESGSGKELVAGAVHSLSQRREASTSASTAPPFPSSSWRANCSGTKRARSPAP